MTQMGMSGIRRQWRHQCTRYRSLLPMQARQRLSCCLDGFLLRSDGGTCGGCPLGGQDAPSLIERTELIDLLVKPFVGRGQLRLDLRGAALEGDQLGGPVGGTVSSPAQATGRSHVGLVEPLRS